MWIAKSSQSILKRARFSCQSRRLSAHPIYYSGYNLPMPLDALLYHWKYDPLIAKNIITWQTTPPRPAQTHLFPEDLPVPLQEALITLGISTLYSHQFQDWTHVREGKNIVLATGTASGKTLAYNLPVLAALLEDENARSLYLFPTKALTQDQYSNLQVVQSNIKNLKSVICNL